MAILAGEDVGLADPNAMRVVVSCWEAFERIGMPEGRFHLAQAALYLATCPKSNSTLAFFDALAAIEKEQETDVPNHLKDGNRDSEGFGHGKGYLYPHAYRDHWVEQQYLPDSLQGKLFYQPSDQGYERRIRDEVAQRREAQLAAMVEASGEWQVGSGEIFTTSPTNRAKDAWLQRTISRTGRNLAAQRDKLFELVGIQRHHLVLDVNAGTGLLTWEAVRRAPEGGVWALTADVQAGEALRQQASKLVEVERPFILIGELNELETLLSLRNEADLKFDRIIARNLFTSQLAIGNWQLTIDNLVRWLAENGRLALLQTIPRHTQRLYELVEWPDDTLCQKVVAAEEAIYHDESDPLVNWDENDLGAALQAAGLDVQMTVEKQTEQRRITPDHLARWFPDDEAYQAKASYAQRLVVAGLSDEEVGEVRRVYGRGLQDQLVNWVSKIAFLESRIQ
jgi:putative ATPase